MAKWTDALNVIGGIAPMIAAAAAGPLAGSAVTAIEGAFGLHAKDSLPLPKRQEAIAAAVTEASPDALLELKKAELDFQARMAQLGFADTEALQELAVNDRSSARQREVAIRDWTPHVLAMGVTGGFFGVLFLVVFSHAVPEAARQPLDVLLGSLGAGWMSVLTYYFGSSADSHRKTEIMADQADKK